LAQLLFDAKAFNESFFLLHPGEAVHKRFLLNSDFEDPLVLNESVFDWMVSPQQKNRLAIDVSEKSSGAKSLQINLDGVWTPGTPLLSQTFVVDPNTSYRLSFAVKTKDLVTGGPPLIVVNDATNNQLLAKSENFPTATSLWTKMNIDLPTLPTSQA